MNALKRSFTIMNPLKRPTAAPIPTTIRMPKAGF
jgi:hypothetical protein